MKLSQIIHLQSYQLMHWPLWSIDQNRQILVVFVKIKFILSCLLLDSWLERINKGSPIRIKHRNPIEHVLTAAWLCLRWQQKILWRSGKAIERSHVINKMDSYSIWKLNINYSLDSFFRIWNIRIQLEGVFLSLFPCIWFDMLLCVCIARCLNLFLSLIFCLLLMLNPVPFFLYLIH